MTSPPSANSKEASYIDLNMLVVQNPTAPGNSNPWGEYGYFPKLHCLKLKNQTKYEIKIHNAVSQLNIIKLKLI